MLYLAAEVTIQTDEGTTITMAAENTKFQICVFLEGATNTMFTGNQVTVSLTILSGVKAGIISYSNSLLNNMIPKQCYVLILKCAFYLNILDAQDINPSSPVVIYIPNEGLVSANQRCSSFSAVGDMVLEGTHSLTLMIAGTNLETITVGSPNTTTFIITDIEGIVIHFMEICR